MSTSVTIDDADNSFKVLFYKNPLPMWIVGIESLQFLAVNDAAVSQYGYSRDEFLQLTLLNIRPPEEHQEMKRLIRNIPDNQTIKQELTHIKKDGSHIAVHITAYSVRYRDQLCRMVIIDDVTEKKNYELQLRQALERIRQNLESITDGFITLNREFKITYWNKEAARILQVDLAEMIGKPIAEALPNLPDSELYKRLDIAFEIHETEKFEEYLPALDKWICVAIYPNEGGMAVYFQDTTKEKKDHATIEAKNKKLEEVAHINSHELRRQVANIMGIVDTLTGDRHGGDLEDSLQMLRHSAASLDHIVR
jgi:PAS domain S-box-containing protein